MGAVVSDDVGMGRKERPHGFVSYAQEDKGMVTRLLTDLRPLVFNGLVADFWADPAADYGQAWSREVAEKIASADVFIVCISPAYLASEYRYTTEMPAIRSRHASGHGLILPVVLKPCILWDTFSDFVSMPIVHARLKPISRWSPMEGGYHAAADQIKNKILRWQGMPAPPEPQSDPLPPERPLTYPVLPYKGPFRLSDEAIKGALNQYFEQRYAKTSDEAIKGALSQYIEQRDTKANA